MFPDDDISDRVTPMETPIAKKEDHMSDTRTTEEKLKAEADTKDRVQSEAALAYLRGRKDQLEADGVGTHTLITTIRHDVEMLKTLIERKLIPLPSEMPIKLIIVGLDAILDGLPAS